jgi:hypothetical protein
VSGVTETVGWVPFVFLAVVVLGFLTWQGGLFGIQVPNHHYKRFQDDLHAGRHVLFVEVTAEQEAILKSVLNSHPKLKPAGDEHTPIETAVVVGVQNRWKRFLNWAP